MFQGVIYACLQGTGKCFNMIRISYIIPLSGSQENAQLNADRSRVGNVFDTARQKIIITRNTEAGESTITVLSGVATFSHLSDSTKEVLKIQTSATQPILINGVQLSPLQARVSTQFDKTTDTTLANITGLSNTVVAGKTYRFEAVLYCQSASTGGVKVAIAGTATATAIIYDALIFSNGGVSAPSRCTSLGSSLGLTDTLVSQIKINGTITVNAGGTLTTQFAQNASDGTPSSVMVGSTFVVTEIS